MNKYELALVVNAKIDDEARAAVVEKAKDYIARYNGTVTEVEEWGKKRLAKSRKCAKVITTSSSSSLMLHAQQKLKDVFALWTMY